MGRNYGKLFQSWEIAIANKMVQSFQEDCSCLQNEDSEDLIQECLIHWYYVRDKWTAEGGASRKTFMARVLSNKLTDLCRGKMADKREVALHSDSLDEPVGDDDDELTLIETLDVDLTGGESINSFQAIAQRIDLTKALEKLTKQQQQLCQMLKEGINVTEASRRLGIHRTTAHDEIRRIRTLFAKQGLLDYLK